MNLVDGFAQHALLAGVPIAVAAGLAGYFLVLRSQVFSADALSHVAFTGALGALAVGADPVAGLFAATILGGALMAMLGAGERAGDVAIGTTFSWILGLGVLALSVYSAGAHAGADGAAGVRVLFGSIFGLDLRAALVAAGGAIAVAALLVAVGRPLLFASLDPVVAAARGVPVGPLGIVFLAGVGATAAVATQAIGALLMVGLLAAPAGAAGRLTSSPYAAMAWSAALAAGSMIAGIAASLALPKIPPSFAILSAAVLCYLTAFAVSAIRGREAARHGGRARPLVGPDPSGQAV